MAIALKSEVGKGTEFLISLAQRLGTEQEQVEKWFSNIFLLFCQNIPPFEEQHVYSNQLMQNVMSVV